ncbi:MAG: xanthine dehydrogenase family protein molybdopterin-binding subunit [Sphaerochaetaceae bacterium]|jgi:carbon-monoxide dehydrogenase large subunit|nr:xanthine dehydrogenase family protein molybdopterin-binding subunit [Sphaerochaetaceae bacterium]MDD3940968.1 xanthine dehydrogenase family protein molybdopterin-binding subunit [Sphaerochaetaceae bacterium]MDX9939680.1 xanthine dehydrogenase family protein molybdopterin-binding subunit [Sphaerochaetaceae bacterium]
MSEYTVIGKPALRKDSHDKVTGSAQFCADITLTGMLHGAVLRSKVPHGIIKSIDVSAAKEAEGVRAVVTGEEVPYRLGRSIMDQTFLAIDKVRHEGEPIALVAADTLEQAYAAVRMIKVDIEPLPAVNDVLEAMKPESALVHDRLEDYWHVDTIRPVNGTNIYDHFTLRKGDVDKAFAEADVIVENEYDCAILHHAAIENHLAIAKVDGSGKITVWSPAQSPYYIRGELSRALKVPENKIRVIVPPIGGGFGGKLEARAEQLAIALAMKTHGRPVKVAFSREEDFLAGTVRAGVHFKMRTAARKDGKILAVESTNWWDSGAYSTISPTVTLKANVILAGPYEVDNVKMDGYCVATNKQLGTAQRGFGVAEASYAHEQQMDAVAKALGMDPYELRMKNVMVDGCKGHTGEKMFAVGIKECLKEAAEGLGWEGHPTSWITEDGKIRGRGLGTFMKFTGTPSYTSATIKLNFDGSAVVSYSTTELGQGVGIVIPQIVAEELGIPLELISTVQVDTDHTPLDKTTTSSRATYHLGNATIKAAEDARRQICQWVAFKWKTPVERIEFKKGGIIVQLDEQGKPTGKQARMDELAKNGLIKNGEPILGYGSYETTNIWHKPDPETYQTERLTAMWFFGANAAEVEIDPDTAKIRVVKVVAAHDIGKTLNPLGCLQQVEGGVIMGIGNTLLEEFIHRDGYLMNGNMVDFKIPTSMDSDVEIEMRLIESSPHPEGPYGAKGIGEPAMCATQSAVASAVAHALGVPVVHVPIKGEHILAACRKRLEEANDR